MLGCLLSGRRALFCNGRKLMIGAYELILIPAGIPHSCEAVDKACCEWLCLHIPSQAPAKNNQPDVFSFPPFAKARIWGKDHAERFIKITGMLISDCKRPAIGELERFVHELEREKEDGNLPRHEQIGEKKIFPGLDFKLRQIIPANISLPRMAEMAGMEKFQFLRVFRAVMGITPVRYLENLRINMCANLLRNGANLADCAVNAGFYDQSHFSRRFKASMGLAPGIFRDGGAKPKQAGN